MENLNQIIKQFPEVGEVKEVKALTSGLINQTYLVKTVDPQEADYVLQRINHQIFTDIDMLQHNIEVVTGHIRKKLEAQNETDIDRKVLRFLPATDGKTFYYDGEGYWRVSVFIPRSQTLEAVTPDSSYLAGLKFGEFQAMLADVPEQLGEIIPDFHNMEFRMKQLREAVATNAAGRLSEVQDIVDAIEKDADEMCSAERLFREGKLPKRICHCDTKVSNMLFDEDGKVLCVIDLDTVMPSFIFSDFRDYVDAISPLRCCHTLLPCSHICRLYVSWPTISTVIRITRPNTKVTIWYAQKPNINYIWKQKLPCPK